MALSRIKTWTTEVLASADLNAEFNNILNNARSLISPLTGDLAAGGNSITGLALGSVGSPSLSATGNTATGLWFSSANIVDISANGVRALRLNTATSGVNFWDMTPAATGAYPALLATGSDATVNAVYDTKGAATYHSFKVNGTEVGRIGNSLTAKAALYSDANKNIAPLALTNGQLVVGSTGAIPVAATLTAAQSIVITNAAGAITVGHLTSVVAKTANETVNGSQTLQNDDELLFAMAASTTYRVELVLSLTAANTTAKWKFGWTAPASATMAWGAMGTGIAGSGQIDGSWNGTASGSTGPAAILTVSDSLAIGSAGVTNGLVIWAIVYNSTNAGNLQFQWCQNVSNASNNVVNAGSHMMVTKLY